MSAREHPIMFSAPMTIAINEDRKSQTRRIAKLPHMNPLGEWEPSTIGGKTRGGTVVPEHACLWHTRTGDVVSPRWRVGDRIWVKETWATAKGLDDLSPTAIAERCYAAGYSKARAPIKYAADLATRNGDTLADFGGEWGRTRSSIHMPRWASRITLEVTGVRVERLQAISAADAWAEGIPASPDVNPIHEYAELWDSINAPKPPKHIRRRKASGKPTDQWDEAHPQQPSPNSWDANPWVWVVSFRQIEVSR